jgi:hypothetical protein
MQKPKYMPVAWELAKSHPKLYAILKDKLK